MKINPLSEKLHLAKRREIWGLDSLQPQQKQSHPRYGVIFTMAEKKKRKKKKKTTFPLTSNVRQSLEGRKTCDKAVLLALMEVRSDRKRKKRLLMKQISLIYNV